MADRRWYLNKRYNITPGEYINLCEKQYNKCAICEQKPKRLAIDHDHVTGKIRGLLCFKCNTAIGKLGDDISGLEKALKYLKNQ